MLGFQIMSNAKGSVPIRGIDYAHLKGKVQILEVPSYYCGVLTV